MQLNEIILTPGEKVVVGTRLTIWAAALVFAGACAYYIGRELFPSKMSPNSVFNSSFELIRNHPDVTKRFGAPLKAYGRDHGGHREGRRNFVEYVFFERVCSSIITIQSHTLVLFIAIPPPWYTRHTEYTDKDDGTKRTRVRYNLEGQAGDAFVFAEVSNDLPSGEFVYSTCLLMKFMLLSFHLL
jgi:import inner membrane translocase subunit TIM21